MNNKNINKEVKKKHANFKISQEQYIQFRVLAAKRGCSLVSLYCQAVEEFIKNQKEVK